MPPLNFGGQLFSGTLKPGESGTEANDYVGGGGGPVLSGPNGPVGPSLPAGWKPMQNDYIPPPPGWTPPKPPAGGWGNFNPIPGLPPRQPVPISPTYQPGGSQYTNFDSNRGPITFPGMGVTGSMQQAQYGMGLMPPRSGRMVRIKLPNGMEQNVPEEHAAYYQSQGATLSGY